MLKINLFILLIIGFLLNTKAQVVVVNEDFKEELVEDKVSILNVKGDLELYDFVFQDYKSISTSNYSYKDISNNASEYWLKIQFYNDSKKTEELVLGTSKFENIQLYYKDSLGDWKSTKSGLALNHKNKELVHGANNYLPFTISGNTESVIFLKVKNENKIKFQYQPLNFTVYSKKKFEKVRNNERYFTFFFLGAILLITLYNLGLYFIIRHKIYLIYSINNLIIIMFVLAQTGFVSEIVFGNSLNHEELVLSLGVISYLFYLWFANAVLEIKRDFSFWHKILSITSLIMPLFLIFVFTDQHFVAVTAGALIAMTGYNVILFIAFKKIKTGNKVSLYFLIANLFAYVGILLCILQITNVLPFTFLGLRPIHYVEIGTLFQLTLFSLVLGYKMASMKEEIAKKEMEKKILQIEEEQRRIAIVKEQNILLERKVEERTENLKLSNDKLYKQSALLELQRDTIQEKNKDILDSILCAERIQKALMPNEDKLKSYFKNSFLFLKPKDVVSGDFYYIHELENEIIVAVCDCTGHGVPGAMVSVICNNALNRTIREFGITSPEKILGKVRELIIVDFSKNAAGEIKEGMDVAICKINKLNHKVQYSGANNSLYRIVDKNINDIGASKETLNELKGEKLLEYKADNQPVGEHTITKDFKLHNIQMNKGESIYLFTDGFVDQFGGTKGKKYKYSRFKNFLININELSFNDQKNSLDFELIEWMGDNEQIDDICVLGLKL